MKQLQITQEVWKEGDMFIAYCPELDIPACGETIEKAKSNLKEVIKINFEEMEQMQTLDSYLQEYGFIVTNNKISIDKEIIDFNSIEMQIGV